MSQRLDIEALATQSTFENVDDLADKLCYIIKNENTIQEQKELNFIRVKENFTWNRISDLYIEFINNIKK